jgi:hypothetical protein
VTVSATQAASPLTLHAIADKRFAASINGSIVAGGGLGGVTSATVTLQPGANTLSFEVSNDAGFDQNGNPAGLAWWLLTQ